MQSKLQKALEGITLESPAPTSHEFDYGRIEHVVPQAVVRPKSPEEVMRTLRFAAEHDLSVVPRGHGCSSTGLVLSEHLVLDTCALVDCEIQDGSASVGPGMRWSALEETLIPRGFKNRVLVNSRPATVGGTLSVGGFGTQSGRFGPQINLVRAIDIVTYGGDLIHAEPEGVHRDLFRFSLAGLGQMGIIVRAQIEIEPVRSFTHLRTRIFPRSASIREISAWIDEEKPDHQLVTFEFPQDSWIVYVGHDHVSAPPDPAEGVVIENYHRFQFEATDQYFQFHTQALLESKLVSSPEEIRNLWNDYAVPLEHADAFFATLIEHVNDVTVTKGFYGGILDNRSRSLSALPLSPVPPCDRAVTFGPYCLLGPSQVGDYKARFSRLQNLCLDLGGRCYLYGWHPRERGFYERQFGKTVVAEWENVKRRYDPKGRVGVPLWR